MEHRGLRYRIWRIADLVSGKMQAALAHTPDWVALRRLGQSRLLALTALVPFLGTLILFNKNIVEFLTVSTEFVRSMVHIQNGDAENAAQIFTLNRLILLYFGLSLLGLGSFAFNLTCPPEIRTHETAMEYITAEQPLITSFNIGVLVERIVSDYLYFHGEVTEAAPWTIDAAYPEPLRIQFINLIQSLTASQEDETDVSRSEPLVSEEEMQAREVKRKELSEELGFEIDLEQSRFGPGGRYFSTGNLNVELVAHELIGRQHANRVFWEGVDSEAKNYPTDLLMLRFRVANLSRPGFRLAIVSAYGLGFALLLFPTVESFVRICARMIGSWLH